MSAFKNENSRARTGGSRAALVAIGVMISACSSLLGIEELDSGPRDGDDGGSSGTSNGKGGSGGSTGGASGSAGSGQGGSTGGDGATGGAGGTAGANGGTAGETGGTSGTAGSQGGNAGTAGTTGGAAGDGMGGDDGVAGMGEAGTGGTTPVDMTVRGKVIDFYRRPIPSLAMEVGGENVVTGADGTFVVPDVAATYDASFIVNVSYSTVGWVYQGLTRRDPTLQVYSALPDHYMNTVITPENGAPSDTQEFTVSYGSPDLSFQVRGIGASGVYDDPEWRGPTTTASTIHGLLWSVDAGGEPSDYVAYDTFPLTLSDTETMTIPIEIDLTADDIEQGTVGGTVTDALADSRLNYAFARFTSGGTITLLEDDPGPDTFSYIVPSLPNASITVAASDELQNGFIFQEYSIAYQDGLAPGTTGITLDIPATAVLTSPADATLNVTDATPFRYQHRQTGVGAAVLSFENWDSRSQHLYVVTSATDITLPNVLGSPFMTAGAMYIWLVETHGTPESVDAMAGPQGFMSPFSVYGGYPRGPQTETRNYTSSEGHGFVMTP
jgi:hypothetical protein